MNTAGESMRLPGPQPPHMATRSAVTKGHRMIRRRAKVPNPLRGISSEVNAKVKAFEKKRGLPGSPAFNGYRFGRDHD